MSSGRGWKGGADRQSVRRSALQIVLFFASSAAIYLILRFGDLVPPARRVAINVLVVAAFVLLAWRLGKSPPHRVGAGELAARLPAPVRVVRAAALVLGLTLPIWVILYFVWLGGQFWR